MHKEASPSEKEFELLALNLAQTFIQRRDLYAKQLADGSYVAVHEPLTDKLLVDHLKGEITLGAYALDQESRGKFLVYDADSEPDWRRLVALSAVLWGMGANSYLERSRRGGHLWLFFDERKPGRELRKFGEGVLTYFGIEGIEQFPKQEQLGAGPGSLIRLPFGIHRTSGQRYGFFTSEGQPLASSLREQIRFLDQAEIVTNEIFEKFRTVHHETHKAGDRLGLNAESDQRRKPEGETQPSNRIKDAITVRDFVLQYVELSPSGRGLCPFHDDEVESFSVNEDENYWHCFGCEVGGSIIDFWMKWQDCDFKTAITELSGMVLDPVEFVDEDPREINSPNNVSA